MWCRELSIENQSTIHLKSLLTFPSFNLTPWLWQTKDKHKHETKNGYKKARKVQGATQVVWEILDKYICKIFWMKMRKENSENVQKLAQID